MFSNQNFQVPVIILLIGVYGVLSLNGFSSDQVAQWKVDFVIEKAPSKQLIEYRKEQINNEVIKKPNASKEEDTKSDEKFLEGFIEKIKALREKVEDEVIPLITNKKGVKKNVIVLSVSKESNCQAVAFYLCFLKINSIHIYNIS